MDNDISNNLTPYIRELQEYLRFISYYDKRIPLISVDGIYGPETKAAVEAFQEAYGLPVTGKVDKDTWYRIYSVYTDASAVSAIPVPIQPYKDSSIINLKLGDQGEDVYLLQVMLSSLFREAPNLYPIVINGIYDENTKKAISRIQQSAFLTENGIVDKETWNNVVNLYNTNRLANLTNTPKK